MNLFENLQAMHESEEVKTFNISFKKDGVYQANLIKGYSEEQVTEFYANYKPDAEIIGVKLATNDDMKPGKPVIDATKEVVKEADKITDDPAWDDTFDNVKVDESEKEVKPAELRTMSGTDIYAWQGAADFKDGSKPLIADGEYATMIVSGPDSSDSDEAMIGIYFGDENEHWAMSTFISKEKAIKYAKMLLPLLNEEIDDYDLKRFGFEIVA